VSSTPDAADDAAESSSRRYLSIERWYARTASGAQTATMPTIQMTE
jgi:hypothetical protein